MEDKEIARFSATIPQIQSALKVGDGARLQLDIPDSEIAEVMKLIAYGRNKVLKVSIEEGGEDDLEGERISGQGHGNS